MAHTYAEYRAVLARLVQADSLIIDDQSGVDDYDTALLATADTYSHYKTKIITVDIAGTGAREYSLPNTWEAGTSENKLTVEYPVDDANPDQDVIRLEPPMYLLYDTPTETKIRFKATQSSDIIPAAGKNFRITFPIKHKIAAASVTVPDSDFIPTCFLGGSILCEMLAVRYASLSDSVVSNGTANYGNKSKQFTDMADRYMERFKSAIFGDKDQVPAEGAFIQLEDTWYRRDFYPLYPRGLDGKKLTDV